MTEIVRYISSDRKAIAEVPVEYLQLFDQVKSKLGLAHLKPYASKSDKPVISYLEVKP